MKKSNTETECTVSVACLASFAMKNKAAEIFTKMFSADINLLLRIKQCIKID